MIHPFSFEFSSEFEIETLANITVRGASIVRWYYPPVVVTTPPPQPRTRTGGIKCEKGFVEMKLFCHSSRDCAYVAAITVCTRHLYTEQELEKWNQ